MSDETKKCADCVGTGKVYSPSDHGYWRKPCPACTGTGLSPSPAPSKPEGVSDADVLAVVSGLENVRSDLFSLSRPAVSAIQGKAIHLIEQLRSSYDAKCAEVERLKIALAAKCSELIDANGKLVSALSLVPDHVLCGELQAKRKEWTESRATIATLRSQLAEAQRDAGRYRWIRECPGSRWPNDLLPIQNERGYRLSAEDLDNTIDAQLALTGREGT